MKITEIFDLENCDSNLIIDQNTYILIHDYEDYKSRLIDHSFTLELLTQRALNLSLFNVFPQTFKRHKLSYRTKNEKNKQLEKAKIEGIANCELSVIRKLLMVNLRCIKIMQRLFDENAELQVLLNDTRAIAKKQKQKIERAKKENESLKNAEIQLNKRLASLVRQLNKASKSFIASFTDYQEDECAENISTANDKSDVNSQNLMDTFDFSSGKFLQINQIHQELSFNDRLDNTLKNLKIRFDPRNVEIPSIHLFSTTLQNIHVDREIKYPLSIWKNKNQTDITASEDSRPISKECMYKIDKDVQNAIRLHCVNSSLWKSFLLMKTCQEFVMFNQVYELITAFITAAEACETEEISSQSSQTVIFQMNDLHLFASESSDCTSLSTLTLNETMDEVSGCERIKSKKRCQRTKVFYNLKHLQKRIVNRVPISNRKSKQRILRKSFLKAQKISIGVGDAHILLVDRESQFDNDIYLEPMFESFIDIGSNITFENDDLDRNDITIKTLYTKGRDYKKSLKSLGDVIKSCKKNEREIAVKPKRNVVKRPEKIVNTPGKRETKLRETKVKDTKAKETKVKDTKVKETKVKETKVNEIKTKEMKKKSRNEFDFQKKEHRKSAVLPEMSKMYQIILQNSLPRGMSFEYLTHDKSNAQLLFVSKSQDNKRKMP